MRDNLGWTAMKKMRDLFMNGATVGAAVVFEGIVTVYFVTSR